MVKNKPIESGERLGQEEPPGRHISDQTIFVIGRRCDHVDIVCQQGNQSLQLVRIVGAVAIDGTCDIGFGEADSRHNRCRQHRDSRGAARSRNEADCRRGFEVTTTCRPYSRRRRKQKTARTDSVFLDTPQRVSEIWKNEFLVEARHDHRYRRDEGVCQVRENKLLVKARNDHRDGRRRFDSRPGTDRSDNRTTLGSRADRLETAFSTISRGRPR